MKVSTLMKVAAAWAVMMVTGGFLFGQSSEGSSSTGIPSPTSLDPAAYEAWKASYYAANPHLLNPATSTPVDSRYANVPGFVPTGDDAVDAAAYEAAKTALILEGKLEGADPTSVIAPDVVKEIITQSDYLSADPDKKAYIDANPDLFTIIPD